MTTTGNKIITFEEGWDELIKPKAIDELAIVLEGGMARPFPPEAFMPIYT